MIRYVEEKMLRVSKEISMNKGENQGCWMPMNFGLSGGNALKTGINLQWKLLHWLRNT